MDLSTYFSVDFLLSFVTLANVLAAIGGLCTVASMSMKTVIPLRIAGIAGAFFFLCSGIFSRTFPSIFLYSMLLPLNSFRLYQMMELHRLRQTSGQLEVAPGDRLRWQDVEQRPDSVNYEATSLFLAAKSSHDCWDI